MIINTGGFEGVGIPSGGPKKKPSNHAGFRGGQKQPFSGHLMYKTADFIGRGLLVLHGELGTPYGGNLRK